METLRYSWITEEAVLRNIRHLNTSFIVFEENESWESYLINVKKPHESVRVLFSYVIQNNLTHISFRIKRPLFISEMGSH